MDDYKGIVGGGLKLKGSSSSSLKKKKKVKTLLKSSEDEKEVIIRVEKTAAEIAHEQKLKERKKDRISKMAQKSHKEKVQDFNKYLSELSEHHDVPKVGPG